MVKRGSVKRGTAKRGSVKRGSVKRGSVKRMSVKRGSIKRMSIKRGSGRRNKMGGVKCKDITETHHTCYGWFDWNNPEKHDIQMREEQDGTQHFICKICGKVISTFEPSDGSNAKPLGKMPTSSWSVDTKGRNRGSI